MDARGFRVRDVVLVILIFCGAEFSNEDDPISSYLELLNLPDDDLQFLLHGHEKSIIATVAIIVINFLALVS